MTWDGRTDVGWQGTNPKNSWFEVFWEPTRTGERLPLHFLRCRHTLPDGRDATCHLEIDDQDVTIAINRIRISKANPFPGLDKTIEAAIALARYAEMTEAKRAEWAHVPRVPDREDE